ncbi:MAG TPA: tripartite tricarboxylate transporter substrate-binding protein [Alphaproteobacteria bacterium]|nr:tripartite tricarboxylate transporter substrate-binding protein [Alphaproteobacteria bacterium]
MRQFKLAFCISALCAFGALPAAAQSAADFYKGKTVSIVVGFAPGGGYDLYGRLVARHMGAFIPGKPDVIVQNRPGAGSGTAASYIYNATNKDGTQIGIFLSHISLNRVLEKNTPYVFEKFTWLGRLNTTQNLSIVWATSPVKTVEDAKTKEVVLAASGPESATSRVPIAFNRLLGTKFKVVRGYDSSIKMAVAMEQGETEGVGGISLQALQTMRPQWLEEKKLAFLYVTAMERHKSMPNVPAVPEFARNDEERQILRFIMSSSDVGVALAGEPAIPAERAVALRKAFDSMVVDKAFIAEADKMKLDLEPLGGEALMEIMGEMGSLPESVLNKARDLLQIDG